MAIIILFSIRNIFILDITFMLFIVRLLISTYIIVHFILIKISFKFCYAISKFGKGVGKSLTLIPMTKWYWFLWTVKTWKGQLRRHCNRISKDGQNSATTAVKRAIDYDRLSPNTSLILKIYILLNIFEINILLIYWIEIPLWSAVAFVFLARWNTNHLGRGFSYFNYSTTKVVSLVLKFEINGRFTFVLWNLVNCPRN